MTTPNWQYLIRKYNTVPVNAPMNLIIAVQRLALSDFESNLEQAHEMIVEKELADKEAQGFPEANIIINQIKHN